MLLISHLSFVVCSFSLIFGVQSSPLESSLSKKFQDAVDAFLAERWDDCILKFESSLSEYRKLKDQDTKCRLGCEMEAVKLTPMLLGGFENLEYVEKLVNKSVCLKKCSELNAAKDFEKLQSYEYLQYCYFQKKLPQKAASAVYTYLSQNPEHTAMLANLRFYVALPDVVEDEIVNLESEPFIKHFLEGANVFDSGRYEDSIDFIERSLAEYFKAEEGCRARCDLDTPDVKKLPTSNYVSSVASHFARDLDCKRRCPVSLTTTNRQAHEDVLPRHYHYLQLANNKIGRTRAACQALASYLLFRPRDTEKLAELHRLEGLSEEYRDFLVPREEAYIYVQRQDHEKELVKMIENNLKNDDEADNFIAEETVIQNKIVKATNTQNNQEKEIEENGNENRHKRSAESDANTKDKKPEVVKVLDTSAARETISDRLDFRVYRDDFLKGASLLKSGPELGGQTRFLAKGLASEDECKLMVSLAESLAIQGSGYQGRASPHTELETFEGLTLGRVVKMVHQGRLAPSVLDTFLEIGDRGRTFVKRQFNVDQKLFFHFSHLVCRKPAAEEAVLQHSSHLSHPIHADNCTIQPDGQCIPDKTSNIVWRDFSAIVYLNDDFEGGELIFASDISRSKESIQAVVPVACGHMVAFSSGRDNLHGVRGVRSGKRCAIGLWFTLNPAQSEADRVLVHEYRDRVRLGGGVSEKLLKFIESH